MDVINNLVNVFLLCPTLKITSYSHMKWYNCQKQIGKLIAFYRASVSDIKTYISLVWNLSLEKALAAPKTWCIFRLVSHVKSGSKRSCKFFVKKKYLWTAIFPMLTIKEVKVIKIILINFSPIDENFKVIATNLISRAKWYWL